MFTMVDPAANKPRRSRTRKILLTMLLLLVAVPVVFLLVEHFRGKRMLAVTIRELQSRGEVLDIARIAPPPVPPASNALDRLIVATSALQPGYGRGPESMRMLGPALAIAGTRLESWFAFDGREQNWSDIADWIRTSTVAFEELHVALATPYRRPVVDYGQGFDTLLPYLSPMKSAVAHLGVAAIEAAQRNDFDRALAELEGMNRIEQDLIELPMLIDQLVRIACASIANRRAWDVLHSQEWSEPQLAALQAALPPTDLVGGIVHAFEGERAMVLSVVVQGSRDLWTFGGPPGEPGQDPSVADAFTRPFRALLAKAWLFAWSDQAAAHFLMSMQTLIDVHRTVVREQSALRLNRFRMESLIVADSSPARLRTVYTRGFLPTLDKAAIKALRCETERALLVTDIALRRFQLRQARFPEQLDELVPEYLPAIPIDRMDGRPVRYRLNPDGTFTLWSIGEDLIDQGGDPTPTRRPEQPSWSWWLAMDAVWPTPASDDDIEASMRKETAKIEKYEEIIRERYGLRPLEPSTNAPAPAD
jgi:hypothetical protein